jgi:hypothetical protein
LQQESIKTAKPDKIGATACGKSRRRSDGGNGDIAAATARGFIEMKGALPIVADGQAIGAIGVNADTLAALTP